MDGGATGGRPHDRERLRRAHPAVRQSSRNCLCRDLGAAQTGRPISQVLRRILLVLNWVPEAKREAIDRLDVPDFQGCGVEVIDPWTAARG